MMRKTWTLRILLGAALCSLLFSFLGCGGKAEKGKAAGSEPGRGKTWEDLLRSYPETLVWRKKHFLETYRFGRSKILERLVKKLSGATSKACFENIRSLFGRIPPDETVPLLEDAIRRLMKGDPASRVILQNTCEAAGYTRDPRLAPVLMEAAVTRSRMSASGIHPGVQRAALEALGACGRPDQAPLLWDWFFGRRGPAGLNMLGRALLLRSLVRIQGPDAASHFKEILGDSHLRHYLQAIVLEACQKLCDQGHAARVAPVLAPFLEEFQGMNRLLVAAMVHQGGILQGTEILRKTLEGAKGPGKGSLRAKMVLALGKGPGPHWAQEVLAFSTDPDGGVRLAVVQAVKDRKEEAVANALEVLAEDPVDAVRRKAMKALLAMGRRSALDLRLEIVEKRTGAPMYRALNDLMAAGDPRLAKIAAKRVETAKGEERFLWMRVLGRLSAPESVPALMKVFLGPPEEISGGENTLRYGALMLSNHPEAAASLMKLVEGGLKKDTPRRARALATLARILALESVSVSKKKEILSFLMGVVADHEADPRDRIMIPYVVLRQIGLDEALRLKRIMLRETEPHVRQGLNDFLWEFY